MMEEQKTSHKELTVMTDFTYTEQNGFITIAPENDQAIAAWNIFADFTDGSGKFFKSDLKNLKAQLKAKGYSVKKAKASKINQDDSALLLALLN